jgi:hypothetical protein
VATHDGICSKFSSFLLLAAGGGIVIDGGVLDRWRRGDVRPGMGSSGWFCSFIFLQDATPTLRVTGNTAAMA